MLLFADKDVIQAAMTSSASAAAEVAGRDSTRVAQYNAQEIKRYRQGLRKDELSSSDVFDVSRLQLGQLGTPDYSTPSRTEDVAASS